MIMKCHQYIHLYKQFDVKNHWHSNTSLIKDIMYLSWGYCSKVGYKKENILNYISNTFHKSNFHGKAAHINIIQFKTYSGTQLRKLI